MRAFILLTLTFVLRLFPGLEENFSELDNILNHYENSKSHRTSDQKLFHDCLKAINELKNDSIKCHYYFRLANRSWNKRQLSNFKSASQAGLKIANRIDNKFYIAKAFSYLGDYYADFNIKKRDSAHYFYSHSRKLFSPKNKISLAIIDYKIAKNLYDASDYYRAEKSALLALKYFKNSDNYQRKFNCYTLLGCISKNLGEPKISIAYMYEALNITRNNAELKYFESLALNNLGRAYYENKDFSSALKCYNDAFNDKKLENRDPEVFSLVLENLALVLKAKNSNNIHIENLFHKAISIRDSLGNDRVFVRINLANYCLSRGQIDRANSILKQAIQIARREGNTLEKISCLKLISSLRPRKEDVKELIELIERGYTDERIQSLQFARILYETDEVKSQKNHESKIKLFFGATTVFLFITLIFLIIIIRQRSSKNRLVLEKHQFMANEKIYNVMAEHSVKLANARSEEQQRIARELHDNIMNRLLGIRLNLFLIDNTSSDDRFKSQILEIQNVEKEIKELSNDLQTQSFDQKTFETMLKDLVHFHGNQGLSKLLYFSRNIDWNDISSAVKINIFRIVQEFINNARKHSNCTEINIKAFRRANILRMSLIDNGDGFDIKTVVKGSGLKNMKYRASLIGGVIEFKSSNKGTRLLITINLSHENVDN